MLNLLSVSRAARLAEVTRAELQARIRRGDLTTFEGRIAVSDLLRLYPEINLERSAILERVTLIKETAVPRTHLGDTTLPEPAVLVERLHELSAVLLNSTSARHALEATLHAVEARLKEALAADPQGLGDAIAAVVRWLDQTRSERTERTERTDGEARLLTKDSFLRIMAANVTLIPSGHEFFVEGSESILDASVRSGLHLSYGCSNGNCGSCKARLVSGRVWRMREHDYVLSESERRMGYILTCSNTAVTDILLEAAEALSVQDLPIQEIRASVRKVEPLSEEVRVLQIQTPRTQTLRFMAGQRVRLALESGPALERHIASCPCDGRNLSFYIRRDPASPFSEAVFGRLKPHSLVTLKGPLGAFVLDDDQPDPTLFVALADGIAPIKSLIEHAVSIDIIEDFYLYWVMPEGQGHYLDHWGRSLRDALDNFHYHPLQGGLETLIEQLRQTAPLGGGVRVYLAGPASVVTEALEALVGLGVDRSRIQTEALQ